MASKGEQGQGMAKIDGTSRGGRFIITVRLINLTHIIIGRAEIEKAVAENFTPEELKRLKAGVSDGGYHYLGAAKIMAPIGKAFAEDMAKLTRPTKVDLRRKVPR